ncbi:MAG TPA: glutamate synthase subunit alpha, partial [Chthonomonadales bacterium]|nr:glutamate synthase subunit alpha [Chthonomonadales bacterium]
MDYRSPGLPPPNGLYHPQQEHDACGVGFVADIKGNRSHQIIETACAVLVNLQHRGACGCDPETGDGAGILIQIPDALFRTSIRSVALPPPGRYGVGMIFLPRNRDEMELCRQIINRIVEEEQQTVLCWRRVPVDNSGIGAVARSVEPRIEQLFVGTSLEDEEEFERKLYVIRRRIENAVAQRSLRQAEYFYLCSLSCRTVVYKGLLLAGQITGFYRDLSDHRSETALALVHQRFSTNTFPTWPLAHPYRFLAHNGEINTLRGNRNWMRAREAQLTSKLFGEDVRKLAPLVNETGSDSATLDNAFELLVRGGRSMPHALLMLIPEAWPNLADPDLRAFYEFHACMMEPWDGPAAVVFSDGRSIGAMLDRN